MDARTVIFFGMSGSGKGTQARLLEKFLKGHEDGRRVLYIETGARFREFMQGDTYTQKEVRKILGEGGLLPAFLPIHVWTAFLVDNFTGDEHLLLDGLSRRVSESPVLDGALKFYGRADVDVVLLELSRETAAKRLEHRGREDDVKDADITKRLDWYEAQVVPAVEFFKKEGSYRVHTIDAEKTIKEIHDTVLAALALA